jgi:hypothetical protein
MLTEEHSHEVGEPEEQKKNCANCILEESLRGLSRFEVAALNWYYGNISQFTLDCGLMPGLFEDLKLDGVDREIFLRAMTIVHRTEQKIQNEKIKLEMERKKNG